jgi:hypothetical protein
MWIQQGLLFFLYRIAISDKDRVKLATYALVLAVEGHVVSGFTVEG